MCKDQDLILLDCTSCFVLQLAKDLHVLRNHRDFATQFK